MEPNRLGIRHSRQWGKRNRGLVGDLLKKINHAVKSSPHFRFSLSSVINSHAGAPLHGHQAKLTMSGDGVRDTSQRIRTNNSSTILTIIPDHDRYRWRKYGEKKIGKSKFPRSYYRCTYHSELNCSATKQVQQCTDDDVTMYKVSYFNKHSCKPCNHASLHNTNATNNSQQVPDFSAKEISTINIPVWQQYSASSDIMNSLQIFDGIPIVDPSVISYLQTSDQGQVGFGGMEIDLSWYQPKNMEG